MKIENDSKIYYNESKWKTNNCGEVEIIGKSIKRNYYFCKFEDGTIVEFQTSNIKNGLMRNPNFLSVCGIGFIGIGSYLSIIDKKKTKEYTAWEGMIRRCYDKKTQIKNPSYIGCTVDERWHNFQNFCEDIKELEGYNEWKNNEKYALDKDCKAKGNKIYSKDTCKFITISENCKKGNKKDKLTGLIYIGIRLEDNYKEEFINQSEFAKKYNLNRTGIGRVLKGKYKQVNGWRFEIKRSDDNIVV